MENIGRMSEVSEVKEFRDSGKAPEFSKEFLEKYDRLFGDDVKNCPVEHGEWSGERGDSKWEPEEGYVPQKMNPDGQSWSEVMEKYQIDGVNFRDGEPDFGSVSKGDVQIKEFSAARTDNFDRADIELAQKHGCTPGEVKSWRKENQYTWHECKDQETMQKVPSIVHNNVTHRGGISEAKKGE